MSWLGWLLCHLGWHDVRLVWTGEDQHLEAVCERCGRTRRVP